MKLNSERGLHGFHGFSRILINILLIRANPLIRVNPRSDFLVFYFGFFVLSYYIIPA